MVAISLHSLIADPVVIERQRGETCECHNRNMIPRVSLARALLGATACCAPSPTSKSAGRPASQSRQSADLSGQRVTRPSTAPAWFAETGQARQPTPRGAGASDCRVRRGRGGRLLLRGRCRCWGCRCRLDWRSRSWCRLRCGWCRSWGGGGRRRCRAAKPPERIAKDGQDDHHGYDDVDGTTIHLPTSPVSATVRKLGQMGPAVSSNL